MAAHPPNGQANPPQQVTLTEAAKAEATRLAESFKSRVIESARADAQYRDVPAVSDKWIVAAADRILIGQLRTAKAAELLKSGGAAGFGAAVGWAGQHALNGASDISGLAALVMALIAAGGVVCWFLGHRS